MRHHNGHKYNRSLISYQLIVWIESNNYSDDIHTTLQLSVRNYMLDPLDTLITMFSQSCPILLYFTVRVKGDIDLELYLNLLPIYLILILTRQRLYIILNDYINSPVSE